MCSRGCDCAVCLVISVVNISAQALGRTASGENYVNSACLVLKSSRLGPSQRSDSNVVCVGIGRCMFVNKEGLGRVEKLGRQFDMTLSASRCTHCINPFPGMFFLQCWLSSAVWPAKDIAMNMTPQCSLVSTRAEVVGRECQSHDAKPCPALKLLSSNAMSLKPQASTHCFLVLDRHSPQPPSFSPSHPLGPPHLNPHFSSHLIPLTLSPTPHTLFLLRILTPPLASVVSSHECACNADMA